MGDRGSQKDKDKGKRQKEAAAKAAGQKKDKKR
jgi:hypothetical protein